MIKPETKTKLVQLSLSPLEQKLWDYICSDAEPNMKMLIDHVYKDDTEGGPLYAGNVIRSSISRMNAKLTSWRIECHHGIYQAIRASYQPFPKSTRQPRPVTLVPLSWDKPK